MIGLLVVLQLLLLGLLVGLLLGLLLGLLVGLLMVLLLGLLLVCRLRPLQPARDRRGRGGSTRRRRCSGGRCPRTPL